MHQDEEDAPLPVDAIPYVIELVESAVPTFTTEDEIRAHALGVDFKIDGKDKPKLFKFFRRGK